MPYKTRVSEYSCRKGCGAITVTPGGRARHEQVCVSSLEDLKRRMKFYKTDEGCWVGAVAGKDNRSKIGWIDPTKANTVLTRHFVYRIAYFYVHGDIPEGWCVCHSCDNGGCFNPQHLWVGTVRDNQVDMGRKGRSYLSKIPYEQRSAQSKINMNKLKSAMTPEERSASARMAANARWNKTKEIK